MKRNRLTLPDIDDESNLPGDPKIGIWMLIGAVFGVFFVTLYFLTGHTRFLEIAILPILIGPIEWLVSIRFNSKDYSELPIDHPIYKVVSWEQFEDDVHIYTSKQVSNRIPLLHIDKSKIFLRSDIFGILSLSSIEWLIKYCRRILKMNRLREIIFVLTFSSVPFCVYYLLTWIELSPPLMLLLIFATSIPTAIFLGGKIFELFLKKQFLAITKTPVDIAAASEAMQSLQSYPFLQRYRFSRHLFLIAGNRLPAKWLTEAKTKSLVQKSD